MKVKILSIFLLVLAAVTVYAADEVVLPADPKVDTKVTYQAKGLTLHKVLEDLSEKTGVVLKCGMNANDWQVRDRKVNLFVKDMPLKSVQKTLATLLHFTWGHGYVNGVHTYRIFQDLKGQKEEQGLRDADEQAKAKKLSDKRTAVIDQFDKMKSMSPEEVEKLKKDSPFLYMMAKEPFGQALTGLLNEIPGARNSLAAGKNTSIPMSRLSPQALGMAEKAITGMDGMIGKFAPNAPNHTGILNNLNSAQIKMEFPGSEMPEQMTDSGFLGMVQISVEGQEPVVIPLMDPTSPIANLMAKAMIRMGEGATQEEVQQEMTAEGMKLMLTPPGTATDPEEELPKDPELEKKIKLEGSLKTLPDLLEQFAKKSEMQVASDQFADLFSGMRFGAAAQPKTEGTIREVLKSVCTTYGKRAKKTGSVITLEDKKWYEKRSWDVPEAWMDAWKKKVKDGKFGFDDVVSIACLTDAQIMHSVAADETLQSTVGSLYGAKAALRLYAVLTAGQKTAMTSEAGLDVSTLSDSQWAYLQDAEKSAYDKVAAGSVLTLHLEVDEESGARTIKLMELKQSEGPDSDGQDPAQLKGWMVTLPPKPAATTPSPAKPAPGTKTK